MELKETSSLMASNDYKDRFKAEYYQLKIRINNLVKLINNWDNGQLAFTPTCPREIYNSQLKAMEDYLEILKTRSKIEKIDV